MTSMTGPEWRLLLTLPAPACISCSRLSDLIRRDFSEESFGALPGKLLEGSGD